MSSTSDNRSPFVMFVFDPSQQTISCVSLKPKRYAVETCFFGDHWENCWSVDGAPSTFTTRAEAEAELEAYLAEVADAVASGDMLDGYDREDFRIVEVVDG